MAAYTLDTKLGEILNNPKAKPVLDKYVPGLAANPMVAMAKDMTINMVLAMPIAAQLGLTKEKAQALLVEVNKVA